ncbi:DUF58 domain-containing protein [Guyparkeria sp.]|uniref:DUF58 domain-containing protein n=1 Tax=Guyparkeria sp. TaxID=2035736 RepID=UPI0035616DE4
MEAARLSRIHVRPRRWGLGMAVVALAMLAAAINYGNNLIFLLAFLLIALMINGVWQGQRLLRPVTVTTQGPSMRPAHTPGRWMVDVDSRLPLPSLALRVAAPDSEPVYLSVGPGRTTRAELALPPAPRGYLPLPTLILGTHYPLGLWTVERRVELPLGQWIHPAPLETAVPPVQQEAPDNGTQALDEGDPTRLRAYQPGDPVRHIVFRHYAKSGRLVTRRPEGETVTTRPTILDYERFRGGREQRLSAMTFLLLQHSAERRPWRLVLPGQPPIEAPATGSDASARRRALQQLARFERSRDAEGFDAVSPHADMADGIR